MANHLLDRRQVGARVEQRGVKGAMPVAAARSRRITATLSSASRRSAKQRAGAAPAHSSHSSKAAIVPEGA
jgi:hypothetical protein